MDYKNWTLSFSGIKNLLISVQDFIDYKTEKFTPNPAMEFGNIYEMFLLDEKSFSEKVGIWEGRKAGNEYKEFKEKYEYVVGPEDVDKMTKMAKSFMTHKEASKLLTSPKIKSLEYQKEFTYEMHGHKFHGFMDLVLETETSIVIVDLKTTSKMISSTNLLRKWYEDGKYYLQEFIYKEYFRKTQDKQVIFKFAVQNNKRVEVVNTKDLYDTGAKQEIEKAVSRWNKFLTNTDVFTYPNDGEVTFCPSKWFENREVSDAVSKYVPPVAYMKIPVKEKTGIQNLLDELEEIKKNIPAKNSESEITIENITPIQITEKQSKTAFPEIGKKIAQLAKEVWKGEIPLKQSEYLLTMYRMQYKKFGIENQRDVDGAVLASLEKMAGEE